MQGSATRPRDRLPSLEGTFVGREGDLAAIGEAFGSGARAVALIGPAGVGKTRLAVEWARARDGARGPARFVDLAGVTSLAGVVREVGDVLDVPLFSGTTEDHVGRLARSLAARGRVLLVLDDVDAAIEIARACIDAWIDAAPDLSVLATSRERLGAGGVRELAVAPLATHGPRSAASRLFVERVREQARGATLAEDDEAIERIVRTLDGVPLAIELAAARVRVASPRQLEALLAHALSLLVDPSRDVERHRSLRVALDESFRTLDPPLRVALARASLFEAPFALEAAPSIAPGAEAREVAALDRLHALVDRSLVHVRAEPELGGERRFSMLSFVRAYAREKLAEIEDPRAAEAEHAEAALAFVDRLVAAADEDPLALRALLREARTTSAVLERALERAEDPAQATIAARAFVALGRVYVVRAASATFLAWASRLEPQLAKVAPALRGRAEAATGYVAIRAGDYARAGAAYERAIAILAPIDPSHAAQLRARLASLRATRGELAAAEALHAEAAALGGALAEPDRTVVEMMGGVIALRAHDEARARACLERALEAARRCRSRLREGMALGYLAWCDLNAQRLPQARAGFEAASALLRDMEEQRLSVAWAGDIATVLVEEGSLDAARERLREAIDAHRKLGDRWYEAERLAELGHLELYAGRLEHAEPALREGARSLAQAGDAAQSAHFTGALALCVAARGRLDEAAALLEEGRDASAITIYRAGVEMVAARGTDRFEAALRVARAHASDALEESAVGARMAGRTLAALADRLAERAPGPAAIAVARDGSWIEAGARISVDGAAARRLLVFLAQSRLDRPGAAVGIDALFDAGWPGEAVEDDKRTNRVRVALTRLRKAGLRSALLMRREGYLLDPTVELRVE